MNSTNRCKELTAAEKREFLAPPDHIAQANLRHDAKYGMFHDKVQWKSAYFPACPVLEREAIFEWHPRQEEARAGGLRIV